jgi:D-inositol-3-phosphate glycosyltransferase
LTRELPRGVALLTGGSDKSYAYGLASALSAQGVDVDFIGSDELRVAEILEIPRLRFLNLRGDQREDVPRADKVRRVLIYYWRLLAYAASSATPILHILWNNKFEWFDRTLLMLFYRMVGKKIVVTVHNVNAAKRDGRDGWWNRATLGVQYRLTDHMFVHTQRMASELQAEFAVPADRITVIPFGINDTYPRTALTREDARRRLGLAPDARALLLFGQLAPYKGLEYMMDAVALLAQRGQRVQLIVAGKIKRGSEDYWTRIERLIVERQIEDLVLRRIGHVPDEDVEQYFKSADAVAIPYTNIFQSGVPFLAFSFGLPVIATDVGSLREDVTSDMGILCRPRDSADLARVVMEFYGDRWCEDRASTQARIRNLALKRYSWTTVARRTKAVYSSLTSDARRRQVRHESTTSDSTD